MIRWTSFGYIQIRVVVFIIRLKGSIGGISFYKSKDGYLAKEKSSIDGRRIASDPAFQRTRENAAEFTRAAKAGALLRNAFRPQLIHASDHRMVSRMFAEMMKVIKSDFTSPRGTRDVIHGAIQLLEGFDFNAGGRLNNTLYASYVTRLNKSTGEYEVYIPSFIPDEGVVMPQGTTHFKLNSGCAIVNFEERIFESVFAESPLFPSSTPVTDAVDLQHKLSSGDALPLFLTLGVQFYQEVNGAQYPLKNGVYNALGIIKVIS